MTLQDRTVLIVEDEIIVAFALEDMLHDLGARAVIASSIDQGFAEIGANEFALAVLDVNVNGAKSYAMAEELQRRAVPIIFATGYGDAEHPAEFAHAPTLTKPYTAQQLALMVQELA